MGPLDPASLQKYFAVQSTFGTFIPASPRMLKPSLALAAMFAAPLNAQDRTAEIKKIFNVTVGTNGLAFRTNDNPSAVDVTPVDRDTFNRANVHVRFRRAASGNVVGFDLNNPVFRNVSYIRSSAR